MSALLDWVVATSIILLVALSAAAVLGRRSAASRHVVLAAGLAATLVMGPLSWLAPPLVSVTSALPASSDPIVPIEAVEASTTVPAAARASWMPPGLLLVVWIAGSTARALWLTVLLLRLSRQT